MKRNPAKTRAQRGIAQSAGRLTKRELEVLRLFAQGLNSKAVARNLSISYTTARNHAQQILNKLGVHSRLGAVARAYRTGLIAISKESPSVERGDAPHRSSRRRAD